MPTKKTKNKKPEQVHEKKPGSDKKELLKEAVSLSVGKQARDIIDFMDDKKYVNEFLIAKKLDITINQTRNILYKLSDFGFVSSIRKRDKRKGWYTYFWKIESIKALEFLRDNLKKRISQIMNQIENRESKTFYICDTCNIEFNEENALLHDFTCSECGGVFKIKDNTKLLRELRKNFERQKEELESIEKEITEERGVMDKRKERVIKKEAKETAIKKAAKRASAKLKRDAAKKASEKERSKKKPKKAKPVKKKTKKRKAVKKSAKKKTNLKKPVKKASKKTKKPKSRKK